VGFHHWDVINGNLGGLVQLEPHHCHAFIFLVFRVPWDFHSLEEVVSTEGIVFVVDSNVFYGRMALSGKGVVDKRVTTSSATRNFRSIEALFPMAQLFLLDVPSLGFEQTVDLNVLLIAHFAALTNLAGLIYLRTVGNQGSTFIFLFVVNFTNLGTSIPAVFVSKKRIAF